jgi:hypothetical protein
MAVKKIRWYVKAQLGVLLLPAGLCLFGEAVIRKGLEELAKRAELVSQAGSELAPRFLAAPGQRRRGADDRERAAAGLSPPILSGAPSSSGGNLQASQQLRR